MPDVYDSLSPSLSSPAINGQTIAPSNSNLLTNVTRAIYVGSVGDVAIEFVSGAQVTLQAVPSGTILPVRAQKVLSSNTTATGLIGLW